jgi:hypothetical protein
MDYYEDDDKQRSSMTYCNASWMTDSAAWMTLTYYDGASWMTLKTTMFP